MKKPKTVLIYAKLPDYEPVPWSAAAQARAAKAPKSMKVVVNLQSMVLDVPGLTQKNINDGDMTKVRKALDKWMEKRNINIESVEEL